MKATLDRIRRETNRLQRGERLLVAEPRRKMPELAPETVERTRTRLLAERGQSLARRRGRR